MFNKITDIFSEEELVLAILESGNAEKVRNLVTDEEFIKKYIILMLENNLIFDEIFDLAETTTSSQLLDIMVKAFIKADMDDEYRAEDLVDEIVANPNCSGETIVYLEENTIMYWTSRVMFCMGDTLKNKYSKEKLLNIANADKKGVCTAGIIEFPNCDEEVFYKAFENNRCNPDSEDYSAICNFALYQSFILKPDILEECLEHFLDNDFSEFTYNTVKYCNEAYLERVMAKIEETSSADVCKKAREYYKKRKGK